jgi:hypothetical protein
MALSWRSLSSGFGKEALPPLLLLLRSKEAVCTKSGYEPNTVGIYNKTIR